MIKEWLANKNRKYSDGVNIYNQVKKSPQKDAFFRQVQEVPPSDVHFIYLIKELQYILRVYGDVRQQPTVQIIAPSPSRSSKKRKVVAPPQNTIEVKPISIDNRPKFYEGRLDPNQLPSDLKAMYEQNKQLNKEINSLHAKLDIATKDPGNDAKKLRADIRKSLDQKIAQRNENYEALDTWFLKKNNEAYQPPADPAQLVKDIKSAERYLQRNFSSTDADIIEKCKIRIDFLAKNNITWPPAKKK